MFKLGLIISVVFVGSITESFGKNIVDYLLDSSEEDSMTNKRIDQQYKITIKMFERSHKNEMAYHMRESEDFLDDKKYEARGVMEESLKKSTDQIKIAKCRESFKEKLDELMEEASSEIEECGDAGYDDLKEEYHTIAVDGKKKINREAEDDDSSDESDYSGIFDISDNSKANRNKKENEDDTIEALTVRSPRKEIRKIFNKCKKDKCQGSKNTACKEFITWVDQTADRVAECVK